MQRDQNIISLRPEVKTEESSGLEQFQNNVLRPILKLQHSVTLMLLHHSKHYTKQTFSEDNQALYQSQIEQYLSKDTALRQLLLGTFVGMMTSSELEFYFEHQKEISKRLLSMQVKRFVDTRFS